MNIIDISQPLGSHTAVWPGDHPVQLAWTLSHTNGDAVNVAALTTTVHAGTHADGTLHVLPDGATAAAMPLEPYIGPCLVIDAVGVAAITMAQLERIELGQVERLLVRTRAYVDASAFPEPFAHIDPAAAQALAGAGVKLFGTDAPSVDPIDSKDLPAHHALMEGGVAILENLLLTEVEPGEYTLVALPLKLVQADSSPVRAVLLKQT